MSTAILFFCFVPFLALVLLIINLVLAPHNPYKEKDTPFECGIHSFLAQSRIQFTISFFIFGLLFLLFDLEILLIYPYAVSSNVNFVYGLISLLVFILVLTLGFVFELGKDALKIDVKQLLFYINLSHINSLSGVTPRIWWVKGRKIKKAKFHSTPSKRGDPIKARPVVIGSVSTYVTP